MKQHWMIAAATLVAAAPLAAQYQPANPNKALISSMGLRYNQPKCSLKGGGHYLVSSAATYYKSAFDQKDDSRRDQQLAKANEVTKQAITEMGQDQNGAAWYWLSRTYLQQGDVTGADTALTRTETLLPECGEELKSYRNIAFGALIQPAVELLKVGKNDEAIEAFRVVQRMSDASPSVPYNMAIAFQDAQPDSALKYYQMAADLAGGQAKYSNELNSATFNMAMLYLKLGNEESAIAAARKLTALDKSEDAERTLYSILMRSKDPKNLAEAKQIEQKLLAQAEADGSISVNDLTRMGIEAFEAEDFLKAANSFQKALAKESWRRDIHYNLVNTFFALKDYPKMLAGAEKELAAEPLGEDLHRLRMVALKESGDTEGLGKAAIVWAALPVSLKLDPIEPNKDGARVTGVAIGRQATDESGRNLPGRSVTVVVEFLDSKGAVVIAKDLVVGTVADGEQKELEVEVKGKGIVDFRYTEKQG